MKLKDIFEVEKNESILKVYEETLNKLKDKYANNKFRSFNRDMVFDEINYSSGYAKAMYSGKIKEGIELTELELSMICDNGFSHFGGSSSIGRDGTFSVTIYTD